MRTRVTAADDRGGLAQTADDHRLGYGQSLARGQSSQAGLRAVQTARPWWISRWASSAHDLRGNRGIRSRSILTGCTLFVILMPLPTELFTLVTFGLHLCNFRSPIFIRSAISYLEKASLRIDRRNDVVNPCVERLVESIIIIV